MQSLLRTLLTLSIAVLAASLATAPASAASTIRIKVDDQPITSYDINQRATLMRLTGVKGGEKAAIEELINETLQFIEAAKRGVSISEGQVDQAIADISQRVQMTPAGLKKALGSQGVNIETLRRRIKAQMTWQRLVQQKIRFEGASVKGSDVTAALFADSEGSTTTTEYTLQQIVFIVPKGASGAASTQRRREAERFRSRFPGCDGSVEMAKQLKGVVVKNLGRRTSEELNGPDGQDIKSTPVGRTTAPIKSDAGYDLVAVCSVRDLQSNAAARVEAENKLMLEQNKDLGKEYLAELKEKAVIEYR